MKSVIEGPQITVADLVEGNCAPIRETQLSLLKKHWNPRQLRCPIHEFAIHAFSHCC